MLSLSSLLALPPSQNPSEALSNLETQPANLATQAERNELLNLPSTLVALETKIQKLAVNLGTQEFRELTGTQGQTQFVLSEE